MAIASSVTIEIAGNRVPDFLHLSINQRMYQPHEFMLVCRRDAFERPGDSPLSTSINKIGSVITFSIRGINSGVNTSDFFFKGIITGISSSESMSQQEIIIKGHSPDILLNGYPTCRSFDNKTLKQIAELVMQPYPSDQISLSGDPDTNTQFPYIVQYKESDYEFLCRLARRFGQWFFHDGRNLVFGSFHRTTVTGNLGINLVDFHISANLAPLNFEFLNNDWLNSGYLNGPSSGRDITGNLDSIGRHVHDQSLSRFPLSGEYYYPHLFFNIDGTLINGQPHPVLQEKQSIGSRFVNVRGTGSEPLQLGKVFRIKARNNNQDIDVGDFLITGLNHSIDNSMDYRNTFNGIPNSSPLSPDANVRAATVCETQSAYVTDNNDPQKFGRVKVQFIWQRQGQSSPWIRMASPHAGSGSGFYILPEINHEVLVGFEGGDAQNPYIIGPVFNGIAKPDEHWVTGSNDFKILRTKSGHTIEFNDTSGGETLNIYNGSGSSADSNNNKITLALNPDKITIESQGDIEIKADKLELHATSGISIKSDSGDVKIEGTGISLKADGQFKAEGATAEVDGSAQVKIQGGIVQIN